MAKIYDKRQACIDAGFEIINNDSVYAYGETYPLVDPLAIHLKAYRVHPSHDTRYQAMKAAFDILWPKQVITYNYWMERMFREHCNHETEIFTLAAGGGVGKAGRDTALIRTPTGWVAYKDIKVGDVINDIHGGTQLVTGVFHQGVRKIYRVTFNDGTSTECDGEHLWTVYSAKQRDHHSKPQTITTLEIRDNIGKDFSIPHYMPLAGTYQDFTIDPYLMGVLLGNGSLSERSVSAYISNEEVSMEVQALWKDTHVKYVPRSKCWRVAFKGCRPHIQVSKANTKYIPPEYLYSHVSQRLSLLQGLLDTDGYCSKNGTIQYTTVSKQLSLDVLSLARSLGLTATVSQRTPTYTYKGARKAGQTAYTITIRHTPHTVAFRLFRAPYKHTRATRVRRQFTHRKIVSVEYVTDAPAICIRVSNPTKLYLTDDYIVTHNTQAAAYIGTLFWLALPHKRAVIVTSTTIESLKSRIYGYIMRALKEMAVPVPMQIKTSPPPSINPVPPDHIHGIFGIAAKQGTDEQTIKDIIGRHPKNAMLLILDEAPHMPIGIMGAFTNLKKGLEDRFQCIAIGNPDSTTDLHGALSTPLVGWNNIDPSKDFRWQTTQPNGVCLYFNPYDSPAIHEQDPLKKAALSKFLMTSESLIEAERTEGVDSEAFWRFTMGFWRDRSTDKTIVSEAFLKDYDPTKQAEFSGLRDLHIVAGLDPAFSTGGDKCILRLAVLGHHVSGSIVLDYRGTSLLFQVQIKAGTGKSAEIQIADQVIEILNHYNIPLNTLCIDASGQGRGLADVIQLRANSPYSPTKIYSTNAGNRSAKSFDVIISSAHDMWFSGREFISHGQIFGLDDLAYAQLHNRLIIEKSGKKTLEQKADYKRRMNSVSSLLGRSPDEADAAMLALQSAIIHYGFFPGQRYEPTVLSTQAARDFHDTLMQYKQAAQAPKIVRPTYSGKLLDVMQRKLF